MVILYKTNGNHSNQLMQHANIRAFCMDRRLSFVDLNEGNLSMRHKGKSLSAIARRFLYPLFAVCIQGLAKAGVLRTFNFSKPGTSDDFVAASKNGICLVTGWGFSQPDLLQHYREYFQGVFRLEIADSWKEYFENREVLGLHVRRGDYADFENGRYCYSDSQYICILERAIEIIGLRDPRIILFTNDQCLDFSAYRERFIDCVLSKESYEMDHALMSRCAYLVGPPSTFTQWASYLGSVPLLAVYDPEARISFSSFTVFPETT